MRQVKDLPGVLVIRLQEVGMAQRREFAWKPVLLSALAAMWVTASAFPAAAQTVPAPAPSHPVTFSKDIAPILQRSCQRCHRPDSVAPMALITYQQTRPYARAIKQRTALKYAPWMRGVMPPWYVETNVGIQHFKDDPSLTDAEIALFAAWADSGAPEGNVADLPPALKFAEVAEWALGKPDLIVSSPSVFVPVKLSDLVTDIGASPPISLAQDRYTSSAEFMEIPETVLPKNISVLGGRFVFHHATIKNLGDDENAENTSPLALAPHEVGRNGESYPPDAGLLIKAHTRVAFNAHIHSSLLDRSAHLDVGFKLHPLGYEPKYKIRGSAVDTRDIQIEGNTAGQRMEAFWVAPTPVKLMNYEPHMHAAGVRMCMRAIHSVTVIETLNCSGYDHNWTRNYEYADNYAPLLPKGTVIQWIGWFDTTSANKNMTDLRNFTRFGFPTQANMFMTFDNAIQLTDEQYQEELTKRKAFLRMTGEEPIGCPDCYEEVAAPNYLPVSQIPASARPSGGVATTPSTSTTAGGGTK
jgi:hypothetical protein